MKQLIIAILVVLAIWQGYSRYQTHVIAEIVPEMQTLVEPKSQFKCDGRTHCSQMTSCAEATFFLQNCPDVKMDGNNDGVPCEKQWCH